MNAEQRVVGQILAERPSKHGEFEENARATWRAMEVWQAERNWPKLSTGQRHAIYMISHKVARILAGDPNEPDHWLDIEGYAKCVSDRLASPVHPYELDAYAAAAIGWNCSPEEARSRIAGMVAEKRRMAESGIASEVDRVLSLASQSRKVILEKEEPSGPGTPEDGGHHAEAGATPPAPDPEPPLEVGDRVYVKGVKTGVYTILSISEGVAALDRETPKGVSAFPLEQLYLAREARVTPDPKFSGRG